MMKVFPETRLTHKHIYLRFFFFIKISQYISETMHHQDEHIAKLRQA